MRRLGQIIEDVLPRLTYLAMVCVSGLGIILSLYDPFGSPPDTLAQSQVRAMSGLFFFDMAFFSALFASLVCLFLMMIVLWVIGWKTERIRIVLWSGLAVLTFVLGINVSPYAFMIGSVVAGALSFRWFIVERRGPFWRV